MSQIPLSRSKLTKKVMSQDMACRVDRSHVLPRSAAVDRQDDVPGLLLRFDVSGRFDHVLQWVASIDDCPVSPRLDELLEEEDVLLRVSRGYLELHFLVSEPRGPQRQDEILEPVGCQVAAAALQNLILALWTSRFGDKKVKFKIP